MGPAFGRTPLSKRGQWAQLLQVGTQTTEAKVAQRGAGAGPASRVSHPISAQFLPQKHPSQESGEVGRLWGLCGDGPQC